MIPRNLQRLPEDICFKESRFAGAQPWLQFEEIVFSNGGEESLVPAQDFANFMITTSINTRSNMKIKRRLHTFQNLASCSLP